MTVPRRRISPERKNIYYAGMSVMAVGGLLFLSTFVTFAMDFGNFDNVQGQVQSSIFRALGGMALLVVGGLMMRVGFLGTAGSGLVLDPEKAREDLEPWARAGGGLASDAMSEVPLVKKLEDHLDGGNRADAPKPVVKVRCPGCRALNDEGAKFCNQCGGAI
jgi:hypothetical protein